MCHLGSPISKAAVVSQLATSVPHGRELDTDTRYICGFKILGAEVVMSPNKSISLFLLFHKSQGLGVNGIRVTNLISRNEMVKGQGM